MLSKNALAPNFIKISKFVWFLLLIGFIMSPRLTVEAVDVRLLDLPQSDPGLTYVEDSLTPDLVVSNESVSFQLSITNPNSYDIALDGSTSFEFSTLNGDNYSAIIYNPPTLLANEEAIISFFPIEIGDFSVEEIQNVRINISGINSDSQPINQLLIIDDVLTIAPNMDIFIEVSGSLQPVEPSRQSMIVYWVRVVNTSDCAIQLDSRSEIVLTVEDQWVHRTPLLNEITILPGEEKRVDFSRYLDPEEGSIYNWIATDVPDGSYYPKFRLVGTNNCNGTDVFTQFVSTDYITISPVLFPLSGIGKILGHPIFMTQAGAVTHELNLGQGIVDEDPYQILVGVEVDSTCDSEGCQPIPESAYHLDNPYFYLWGSDYKTSRMFIYPTPEMLSQEFWGLDYSVVRMTTLPEGGVGFWLAIRDQVRVYLVEMDGTVEHQSITAENTFVLPGDSVDVTVSVGNNYPYSFRDINNPHYPGNPDGVVVIQPESHLNFSRSGDDISNRFIQSVKSSGIAIPYDTSQDIDYSVQVTDDADFGTVLISSSTTATATYDTYFETFFVENPSAEPFEGPYTAEFTGETLSESQVESSSIVIVEQLPLSLEVSGESQTISVNKPNFDIVLENSSEDTFSITPLSMAVLPIDAKDSLIFQTVEGVTSLPYNPLAQSFVPPVSFLLNLVKTNVLVTASEPGLPPTESPEIFTLELIKANHDGSISNNVMGKAIYIIPEGTPTGYSLDISFEFDNILMESGEVYYLLLRSTGDSLIAAAASVGGGGQEDESYPEGHGYWLTNHSSRMVWVMAGWDFAFQFHGSKLLYECEADSNETFVLSPGESSNLTFTILDDLSKVVDGSYSPKVVVKGEVDLGDEIIPYNQTLINNEVSIILDSIPPSAQIDHLPLRTSPQTALNWTGQDENTGILSYDLQVQIDDGEWTDWLYGEVSTSAMYPSESGHTYAFRVRARDKSLNIGEWSEPTTTEVGEWPAPTVYRVNPSDKALDVSIDTDIAITFDQYVAVSPGWVSIYCSMSQNVPATVTEQNPSYYLELSESLGYFEVCTISIDASKVSPELSEDFSFSFTTEYDPLASPVALNDHYETIEEQSISVLPDDGLLANDFDVNGDLLTVVLLEGISDIEGTLHLNSDGSFRYYPQINFFGSLSFTYYVTDGNSDSNIATVTITVHNVNDPPRAWYGGYYHINEDEMLVKPAPGVLGYVVDPDDDVLTANLVEGPLPEQGILELNLDGSFTFTPHPNYHGSANFTFTADDGEYVSDVAEAFIDVFPVNDRPEALDDYYSIDEDTLLVVPSLGVLENDVDVEGDALTASLIDGPDAAEGVLNLEERGNFTFAPHPDFNGTVVFSYMANDGDYNSDPATVTITVNPTNDQPVALDDTYYVDEDTSLYIPSPGILSNDIDKDGDYLVTVSVVEPGDDEGALDLNEDGSFSFTPYLNHNGTVTFTYKTSDGQLDSNLATVSIVVNPKNDAPTALDDAYFTDEDNALTISIPGVLENDSDVDGDVFTAILVEGPTIDEGILSLNEHGDFTFTPAPDYFGTVNFTYAARDGEFDSNIGMVTITVDPINDPPVANDDNFSIPEDAELTIDTPGILINDRDVDSEFLTIELVDIPSSDYGVLELGADGSFIFMPAENFNGIATFTYLLDDGESQSDTATVSIIVEPVNDAPVAIDDIYVTEEDVPLTIISPGVLINDSDVEGDQLVSFIVDPPSFEHGELQLNLDGSLTLIPTQDFIGTITFTYQVNDGELNGNIATVTVEVIPINDMPIAESQFVSTDEDTAIEIPLLASDVDGDLLTYQIVEESEHGSLNLSGSIATYTPNENYYGTDSFTIKVNDGELDSNIATQTIDVSPVNDLPITEDDEYSTDEDIFLTVVAPGVLVNDFDIEDDALTAILVTGPDSSQGELSLGTDGNFTFMPAPNYNGTVNFTYKTNDNELDGNIATVTLVVYPVNDVPIAICDEYRTEQDIPLIVEEPGLLANDSDADGDNLSAILIDPPISEQGSVLLNADGSFEFIPGPHFFGSTYFTYRVFDGGDYSNVVTVRINVDKKTWLNYLPVLLR